MLDLNKYSADFDKSKMFPTGGFARTYPNSVNLNSKKKTAKVEANKKIVKSYRSSQLGSRRGVLGAARPVRPAVPGKGLKKAGLPQAKGGAAMPSSPAAAPPPATPRFTEPPSRGNPFS